MFRLSLFILLLLSVALVAVGEERFRYSDEAERLWVRGLEQYRTGSYLAAVDGFDRVVKLTPLHQRTTAASIMKARALYELGENLDAARTLRAFLVSYPWSTYVPDAQYLLGLTYLRIRRMDDAMESFLAAWGALSSPDTSRFHRSVAAALADLTENQFTTRTLRTYLEENTNARIRQFLWIRIAEQELTSGNVTSAGVAVDSLDRYAGHPYAGRVGAVRARISQGSSVKIGALLPLMNASEPSAVKEIGNDVFKGIEIAFAEHGADPGHRVKVRLETMDTERDAAVASRLAREMTDDADIIGIIGPVFSHSTSAAVGPANIRGVPLVTPTANSNGIAASGEYVFQANPDFENRGRAMARFAINHLGYKTLAVLAPVEPPGRLLGEAFMDEAISLGARILATEWYPRGSADLSQQLNNIRRAAMMESVEPMLSFAGRLHQGDLVKLVQAGVTRKTLDSLIERSSIVPASYLFGDQARAVLDSIQISYLSTEPRLDSLQYPAAGIEGIYLPISGPGEIGVVSSQIVYFNIKAQMLGAGEWNDLDELNANKRYCTGVIFESDTYLDEENPGLLSFRGRFRERYQRSPSQNALYGYDTARLILHLIGTGASTRELLRSALQETASYQGLHSRIGFTKRRVNSWLWIQQYQHDAISVVTEVTVDERAGE